MSNLSPATVTSLRIANLLNKNGVAPQAFPERNENVKLLTRDSDVIGHCQVSGAAVTP
jgi:hypothetical protein